jgi:hypothetical protein
MSGRWGYGFSYVYYRRVGREIGFLDKDFGEDHDFAEAALKRFRLDGKQDFSPAAQDFRCSCIHVIHNTNISRAFPQQTLLPQLRHQLFPDFRPLKAQAPFPPSS